MMDRQTGITSGSAGISTLLRYTYERRLTISYGTVQLVYTYVYEFVVYADEKATIGIISVAVRAKARKT